MSEKIYEWICLGCRKTIEMKKRYGMAECPHCGGVATTADADDFGAQMRGEVNEWP